MHDALYRAWPVSSGGAADKMKLEMPLEITPATTSLIKSDTAFLYKIHSLGSAQLPSGAVDGSLAQSVLEQSKTDPPVAVVKGSGSG